MTATAVRPMTAGCVPDVRVGAHPALFAALAGGYVERRLEGVRAHRPTGQAKDFPNPDAAWVWLATGRPGPAAQERGACAATKPSPGGSGAVGRAGPGVLARSTEARPKVPAA